MRAVIEKRPAPATQLGWAAGLCVLDIALAGWLFGRVYRHALRTGLIARYSAESVS
jgi:ABC-2 type transport system permease protein